MGCYDNIIGFTQQDCACLATGRPAEYNVSKSGLYLSSLKPLDTLQGLTTCDATVWEYLQQSRTDAINAFLADTNALLGAKYTVKRKPFDGAIGTPKALETWDNDKNYAVLRIACAPIKSGFLKIRGIGTIFNETGTVQISIYNNLEGFISTHTLQTIAGAHKENALSVELPLYSKYLSSKGLEYYIVYQFNPLNLPRANKIDCGCGGFVPKFDKAYPYYKGVGMHGNQGWADWLMIGGLEVNSLTTELDDEVMPGHVSNDAMGLTLDIEISCRIDEVLCQNAFDFRGNPLANSVAYAILFKCGFLMADNIIRSEKLNRDNMINAEALENAQVYWNSKYNEHVNHIVDNANIKANDCLSCKDGFLKITTQGLLN